MSGTINFSVHPNPRPDAEGNTTYQVRHENYTTVSTAALAEHLQHHGLLRPELLTTVLNILKRELVEHLTMNRRVHLEGLGTFYLKIGLRNETDDEGNEQRRVVTDPRQITGESVEVTGIGFTPDSEILELLHEHFYHFNNVQPRGVAGKSEQYDIDQLANSLAQYLDEHGYITRIKFQRYYGLTRHTAMKYLKQLLSLPDYGLREYRNDYQYVYKRT